MSRRALAARVDAPRPASAWVLVTVASATLWITQQLEVWALAIQVVAILVTLARRLRPFAWQRSAAVLNLGMLGIAAATVVVALRGEPSTIALAHFAALTQGLQLADARPRRTEFLLVALALFQVVLAANLTDSVLFTPLLVTFVFAAVWTLMVHTLRAEAVEAGDPRAATRALTPGLLRTTLFASALSVALALVLFVILPRLRSSVVTGSSLSSVIATAGFADHVTLGELGRIRQDPSVVLRVETLEGRPPDYASAYWRGLAFDTFDGTTWSVAPPGKTLVPGSPEGGVTLGPHPDRVNLVQRIVREPVASGVLFGAGDARRLQGTVRRLERDASGGLYAVGQAAERVRYTLASFRRSIRDQALDRDAARTPGGRHLQLPALSAAVAELAREITRDAGTDAERVRAIEHYLLRNGRYHDTPPALDPSSERTPVEGFLFGELAGHCEYFASAMVMLARSIGIPSRLVNGFAGGRQNRIGGFVELTQSDAHAWVEVHFERAGWVRYDPTPPDLRARPAEALSLAGRLRELGSALELWWFQRVVGFDRADQIYALKRAWLAWEGARASRHAARERPRWGFSKRILDAGPVWKEGILAAACLALAVALAWRLRRSRTRSTVPPCYEAALRLLARRGLERPPSATARDFARSVRGALPEAAVAAFADVTEAYLAERFGGRPSPSAPARLHALRESLRRGSAVSRMAARTARRARLRGSSRSHPARPGPACEPPPPRRS